MSSDDFQGDPFGAHRVLEPVGALPQAAKRLDNDFGKHYDTEILIAVDTLNIDAASFRQMLEESEGDPSGVAEIVRDTVDARGKQHNPVTGSGGMLLGTVKHVGNAVRAQVNPGDRIATLVSLTLTPLRIDAVKEVRAASAQLDVLGEAVLFDSGVFAVLPSDMSQRVALAALDVCGAPAQVARGCGPGQRVLILGAGGKSGLLCAVEARKHVGSSGKVIGVETQNIAADELRALEVCDEVISVDARDPLSVRKAALAANGGQEFDLVVSCVNVEGAEMSAILCTRERGKVFFFAMTTHFGRAALGAEGVRKDVDMLIGNGYAEGHADLTLDLLRKNRALHLLFERRYG
jgi:L-erythro-3,5-diaminohexanoate dehydrogenase